MYTHTHTHTQYTHLIQSAGMVHLLGYRKDLWRDHHHQWVELISTWLQDTNYQDYQLGTGMSCVHLVVPLIVMTLYLLTSAPQPPASQFAMV